MPATAELNLITHCASMNTLLDRFFHYSAHGSTLKTEVIAGLSTFAAMAYIICIQPALFPDK